MHGAGLGGEASTPKAIVDSPFFRFVVQDMRGVHAANERLALEATVYKQSLQERDQKIESMVSKLEEFEQMESRNRETYDTAKRALDQDNSITLSLTTDNRELKTQQTLLSSNLEFEKLRSKTLEKVSFFASSRGVAEDALLFGL